jgi:hypothetical protein
MLRFHKIRVARGLLLSLFSKSGRSTLRIVRRLAEEFGHTRSVRLGRPVDAAGNAWPWYTYPAIEYLEQLDLGDRRVFEYGCGHSTIYWAQRAKLVRSVEHNREWYERIALQVPANCRIVHAPVEADYVGAIDREDEPWDFIVVDGLWRPQCAARAASRLARGGVVVVDNSDWYPKTAALLRARGLLQVDFSGFGPVNNYAWTTSVFFDRAFDVGPRGNRQPKVCRGGLDQLAE